MKKLIVSIAIWTLTSFSIPTHANLIDRGQGMIYDTDLNITWLANANQTENYGPAPSGTMSYFAAMYWASNLNFGGFDDWRLPFTQQPDPTCGGQFGSVSFGYNCLGSEMGHLFYNELGGEFGHAMSDSNDPDLALFKNIRSGIYWSSTADVFGDQVERAYLFIFHGGIQGRGNPSIHDGFAWAVRNGDVAPVLQSLPEPSVVALIGVGLIGLRWRRSRPMCYKGKRESISES